MKYLLEAKDVGHGFDTLLFKEVNLSLSPKESLAIVGRSGSGKSTLLHILSTFLEPNEGKVGLLDEDLYSRLETKIESLRRYDVGIL